MATAYRTFAQANSASSMVSSEAVTIPAAVALGDALFLLFQAYSGSSGVSTLTVTSTGSTLTQLGSTVYESGGSSNLNSSLWYVSASATDASKVITCHTSVSNYVNATLAAWSGPAVTGLIDASNIASSASLVSSVPAPAATTVQAGDWALYFASICNASGGFSSCTLTGGTVREANFGSASGITAVGDSNGSVGGASTSIGGAGVHFNPSTTGIYTAWTVALPPKSSPAPRPLIVSQAVKRAAYY